MNIGLLLDPYGEKSPGGLGRCIFEMVRGILEEDTKDTFVVYVKKMPQQAPALPGSNWSIKALDVRRLWLSGGKRIDRALDLYVFFTPIIPLFFRPKKSVVLALDFAYLDTKPRTIKDTIGTWLLYYLHKRSLNLATKVVAISEFTKQSTIEHFNIPADKIEVVHIGYIPPSTAVEAMPVPEHFFLFAGVLKERKNVRGVIEAFAEFCKTDTTGHALVIAGKSGGAYHDGLVALVGALGVEDRVHFAGYVSNDQLAFLYQKATALVFPSFIEGFGMPVLEAMSVGLPVITSNNGALAEVAGSAALLVDPYSKDTIARAMATVVADAALRDRLRESGYKRAQEFSWGKTATAFLHSMQKVAHT